MELRQVKEMLQKSEPYLERLGKTEDPKRRNRPASSVDDFDLDLSGLKETMGKCLV